MELKKSKIERIEYGKISIDRWEFLRQLGEFIKELQKENKEHKKD